MGFFRKIKRRIAIPKGYRQVYGISNAGGGGIFSRKKKLYIHKGNRMVQHKGKIKRWRGDY